MLCKIVTNGLIVCGNPSGAACAISILSFRVPNIEKRGSASILILPTYRFPLDDFCFRSGMTYPAGVFALPFFPPMHFTGSGAVDVDMASKVNGTTQSMVIDFY